MARPAVHVTFSPTGPSRPAVAVRLPQTLARTLEAARTPGRFGICDQGALRSRLAKIKTKKVHALASRPPAGTATSGHPSFGGRRAALASEFRSAYHLPSARAGTLMIGGPRVLGSLTLRTQKSRIKSKVFTKQPIVGSASTPGALWQHVRANPSVNRTRYGRPPWPGRRYAVHFRQPGQAVLP